MSVYLLKGKGWRYDFTLEGTRHTEAWFKTKTAAKRAEAKRREEIERQKTETGIPTDMDFLELINRRLDHVKAYNSKRHYQDYLYLAKRWAQRWKEMVCAEITQDMVEEFVIERSALSNNTANKEIRYLRATFNFGIKKKYITSNPLNDLAFLPVEKNANKYIPTPEDIAKVIEVADPDTRDYLLAIRETMGRVSEINRLTWDDIDFPSRFVILYTRKKKGGHLTPRKVPMTEFLFKVLRKRYAKRDKTKPWVFWHRYWSIKEQRFKEGPYLDRKKIMRTLCKEAGVRYFRFHPIRHSGASVMDNNNVPIGSIQRILGHENRTTTEIYLHSFGDSERQAIAIFEGATRNSHMDSHTNENEELGQFCTTA